MAASWRYVVRRTWRRITDRLAYASTLARLWVYDWIAGPFPATEADVERERGVSIRTGNHENGRLTMAVTVQS